MTDFGFILEIRRPLKNKRRRQTEDHLKQEVVRRAWISIWMTQRSRKLQSKSRQGSKVTKLAKRSRKRRYVEGQ